MWGNFGFWGSIFFGFVAQAHAAPAFPKNWCWNNSCSPAQERIWQEFEASRSAPDPSVWPAVMSGSCYHSGGGYKNSDEHHGGFLVDVEADGLSFQGRFSFFAKENPYRGTTVEVAREQWKRHGDTRRVETQSDYLFFDAAPRSEQKIWYWLRQGREPGQIFMATFYSGSSWRIALCELRSGYESHL